MRDRCRTVMGQAGEPLAEGPEMLAGQQGRRADDGYLLTGHGDHKGGPQRHLGLAEADVAADQAIHGCALAQVFQHIADGVQLVVRLFIREAGHRTRRTGRAAG